MARLRHIEINGYRSIGGDLSISLQVGKPLVIIGENNAGKSNIIRAIDLILGDRWPGNWTPEDHDFFEHDTDGTITITAEVDGVKHYGQTVQCFQLTAGGDHKTELNIHFDDGDYRYPNQETRQQLPCHVINADRRLSYELSYTNQWTLLSRLMKRFHRALQADEGRRRLLEEHFERLHKVFEGVPEYAEFARRLSDEVGRLGQNMPYRLDIDFSAYDPSNYFKALRVAPSLDGDSRTYDELGTGQEQVLALGFAYAYAAAFAHTGEGLILVIEEPEAHLHPLAQEWLASQLHRFTDEGVQVIVTTHSPAFINYRNLDGLALVRKGDEGTHVIQHTAKTLADHCVRHGSGRATPDNVLAHYDISATTDLKAGMFARAVVLVEGITESFALPVLLRKLGLDLVEHGIACIPVNGKGNLAKWWRLFTAYEIPVYIIFDNDTADDGDGSRRCNVLETLGIHSDLQESYVSTTEMLVEASFAVMGQDFEKSLRLIFSDYEDLEAACRAENGAIGKPFIARWVAERMDHVSEPPMLELATAIRSLTPDIGGRENEGPLDDDEDPF